MPQGAVLSPLLLNIYTVHPLTKIDPELSLAGNADDVTLYFSNPIPYIKLKEHLHTWPPHKHSKFLFKKII